MAVNDSSSTAIAEYVIQRLEVTGPATSSFIRRLAIEKRLVTCDVETVAESLGSSKSALYDALTREGLPGIACWQMLFRLMDAAELIHGGASAQDAAYQARFADSRSLRRALHHYFGTSLTQIRAGQGWQWLVDCWIGRHQDRP